MAKSEYVYCVMELDTEFNRSFLRSIFTTDANVQKYIGNKPNLTIECWIFRDRWNKEGDE